MPNHPPVITMFIGGIDLPFPVMAGEHGIDFPPVAPDPRTLPGRPCGKRSPKPHAAWDTTCSPRAPEVPQ